MSQSEPKLVQDARGLSSGTLSYLVDDTRYDVIEAVQFDFVEFCQENPRYENWQTAWNDFKQVYNFAKAKANPFERFQQQKGR